MSSTDLTLAPRQDTSPAAPDSAGYRLRPHNIEAEQALLGAILINNETYNRVADFLLPEHFYDPAHGRIFDKCAQIISRGNRADPITMQFLFDSDEALKELGGARYLGDLARAAEGIVNAVEYARVLHDLALRRGLIDIGEATVNGAFDPQNDTGALEQISEAEERLFKLAQEGETKAEAKPFLRVLAGTVDLIDAAYKQDGKLTGVPTRLTDLDDQLGGLQPSDLLILAARPSMGKSALAMTIAASAAGCRALGPAGKNCKTENYAVAVFSLEMSAEQLGMRLLAAETGIAQDDLRRGKLQDDDFIKVVEASQRLGQRPMFIDDTPALSIAALRTRARRIMRRHGLALLVVDYLQLMRGTSRQAEGNRVQEISEISQGLKAIAKELHVPVLALSQLSRAVEQREDKRPQLSDLRESGSIEQDADVVMFIYRDEYYQARSEPQPRAEEKTDRFDERYRNWAERYEKSKGLADLIVAKQRNGPIGTIKLAFEGSLGRFADFEFRHYDGY